MNVEEAYKRETPIKQGCYHLGCQYNINNSLVYLTMCAYINISAQIGAEGSATEAQNGWGWKGIWRPSCPTPMLHQGHLQPPAQDRAWGFFNISKEGDPVKSHHPRLARYCTSAELCSLLAYILVTSGR